MTSVGRHRIIGHKCLETGDRKRWHSFRDDNCGHNLASRSSIPTNKRTIVMIDYQSTLLGRTEVAEGTMAFQFEKPKNFVFKAGQYIDLTLLGSHAGSSNGLTHTFSIASSPFDEELLFTTRMRRTVFKQALSVLPIGAGAR